MNPSELANKTYIFFAYQYYVRYPMIEESFSIIRKYIKKQCSPTSFHLIFNSDIWIQYWHLRRTNKDKISIDTRILDQSIHFSDSWVKHETKHDMKCDSNEVNKYYISFELPPLEPTGLFPFSNASITEEGEDGNTDKLYQYIKIKKGFKKEFFHEMLDIYLDNNMIIDEPFFEKNTHRIISSYINHHNLIKINKLMRMKNRVYGLWMLDFILKEGLALDDPTPAINELLCFSPDLPASKMIDIYKRTLCSVLKRDLFPMSN